MKLIVVIPHPFEGRVPYANIKPIILGSLCHYFDGVVVADYPEEHVQILAEYKQAKADAIEVAGREIWLSLIGVLKDKGYLE